MMACLRRCDMVVVNLRVASFPLFSFLLDLYCEGSVVTRVGGDPILKHVYLGGVTKCNEEKMRKA